MHNLHDNKKYSRGRPQATAGSNNDKRKSQPQHIPVAVHVVQLAGEWVQAAQDTETDAARSHRTHVHALHVVRALDAVGDVPPTADHLLVAGNVVPDLQRVTQRHRRDKLGGEGRGLGKSHHGSQRGVGGCATQPPSIHNKDRGTHQRQDHHDDVLRDGPENQEEEGRGWERGVRDEG